MTVPRFHMILVAALAIGLSISSASAQTRPLCKLFCAPELLIEPTWTIQNLADRPRISEPSGGQPPRVARELVWELVLAVDVPTR